MNIDDDTRSRAQRARAPDAAPRAASAAAPRLLPVVQKASDHPCFECALCCTYVAVEIDRPSTMKEYDHIVWYLYHPGITVFVDWNGDWFVKFESRCENLTPQGLCGIYERRPAICKDFDWRDCERHVKDDPPDKWLFGSAPEFLAWLAKRRPKAHARYQEFLARKYGRGEEPELTRVEPAGAPAGRTRR
jgi:uncharacterized protein